MLFSMEIKVMAYIIILYFKHIRWLTIGCNALDVIEHKRNMQ